jgi:hypothetical protein
MASALRVMPRGASVGVKPRIVSDSVPKGQDDGGGGIRACHTVRVPPKIEALPHQITAADGEIAEAGERDPSRGHSASNPWLVNFKVRQFSVTVRTT